MQNEVQELIELKAAAFDFRNDLEARTSYYQQLCQQIAQREEALANPVQQEPAPTESEPESDPDPAPAQELDTVG